MKIEPSDPSVVRGFDMLAPEGYGEIIGGSQREDDYETLHSRIVEEGYDPANYYWYLDLRKYGSVPHSGFGLGVERVLMWIAGLDHIRDATPFPRFRERIKP
jgi:asparaginyl-tRNA synthetase